MINFRGVWVSLKAKTAKDLIRKEPEIKRIESTKCGPQFAVEDRRLWPKRKTRVCRKDHWFPWTKRSVWRILLLLFKIFESENRTDYNSHSSKTLSNLNLLSQLTDLERARWNSTIGFFSGIDWTIISIHFPTSKLRACECMISDASRGARFRIAGHA